MIRELILGLILCSVGDKIAIKQSSQSHPLVMESIQGQYRDIPEYIQADIKKYGRKSESRSYLRRYSISY